MSDISVTCPQARRTKNHRMQEAAHYRSLNCPCDKYESCKECYEEVHARPQQEQQRSKSGASSKCVIPAWDDTLRFVVSRDDITTLSNPFISPEERRLKISEITHYTRKIDTIRKEGADAERKTLLKDLQTFIDDADSHEGCPNGTLGTAYLVRWMGGQGWDCD
jgi:hypothetical protein